MTKFTFVLVAGLLAAGAASAQPAIDAKWPAERPIRLIVPFQPGSSSDVIARIVSQRLAERLGQQIVVDNRVGASATLGSEAVARADPDGYTMGLANTTTHASAVALQAKPAYDPVKDFTPVVLIGSSPMVILATPKLAAQNIQELLALAKAKPGALNYASAGPGSMAHLTGALLEKMGNVRMTHVPYRGTAQSVIDLMEGRIELLMGTIAPSLAHIRDGKMRALATTGAKRNAQLPEVPTVAESGLAGYEAGLWSAFVLPAKAPPAVVARINREVIAVVNAPETRAALDKQGVVVETSTPEELGALIRNDVTRWGTIIREAGITAK
ncbi:MAG: tripartite tricarboxylate transporter substrate binding protein [Xanthobacteraceae bacterium]|nr:tripartite tricarboxylate transporter substrate binding protein [Xanthobacteraceae bacterium]